MNQIPVSFVNLFTRRNLKDAVLPTLPKEKDIIYLGDFGYEVSKCEWHVQSNGGIAILILVMPQLDKNEKRPFSYQHEVS